MQSSVAVRQDPKQLRTDLQDLLRALNAYELMLSTQRIVTFTPLPHGDQRNFFAEQRRSIRLVIGDNRSGKTECNVVEAIAHSLGYRPWLAEDDPLRIVRMADGKPIPVPNKGVMLCQNAQQAIRQTLFPKFEKYAPRGWYTVKKDNRGIVTSVHWKNGSETYFMSDEQDDMAFEGAAWHWFSIDEPCGYRKYAALRRGLVDFHGHCWLTLTALNQPWIADVIQSRANDPDGEVAVFVFSIWDNCDEVGGHLTRKAIESFIADLREDERAVRTGGLGMFMHLTGRVFKEWEPRPMYWVPTPKTPIPKTWPRVLICDPHPRKPVAMLWLAVNPDDQVFVYRELWDDSLVTVRDVATKVKQLSRDEPIIMRLIDPASQEQERTSGDSVLRRFAREGLMFLPAKKKNIDAGIDAIHEALKVRTDWNEPGLIVYDCCPVTKQNFMRFSYEDWVSSKQRDLMGERQTYRKSDDDMISCIRYYYQSGLSYRMLSNHLNYERRHTGRSVPMGAVR